MERHQKILVIQKLKIMELKETIIGKQVWSNLLDTDVPGSVKINGIHYYTYEQAIEAAKVFSECHGKVWRLPSKEDFICLAESVNYKISRLIELGFIKTGFYSNGLVNLVDDGSYYWSSTYHNTYSAYNLLLTNIGVYPQDFSSKYFGFAVRCVRDLKHEKVLEITEEQARKLYSEASRSLKEILEFNFGKGLFLNFQDAIKTYEDACNILGENLINEKYLLNCGIGKSEIAFMKLKTIFKAVNKLNSNWKPDYENTNQPKYSPRFIRKGSNFKFWFVDCTFTAIDNNSQLCCGSKSEAGYIGRQFEEQFEELFDEMLK